MGMIPGLAAVQISRRRIRAILAADAETNDRRATAALAGLTPLRTAIKDELRKMKDFPALEGAISFGSNGDALKPVYVIQLQDGKSTLIGQFAPGT